MPLHDFSSAEQASQVSEQLQMATFEKYGSSAQKGLYALAIVLIIFGTWAAFSESDVCAEAKGQLEPITRIQQIKATSDGTIHQYKVRDGQQVKAGDTLIILNTVRAEAELRKKQQELSMLQIQLKQHENARDGLARVIENPKYNGKDILDLPEAERIAGTLYASRKSLDSASYDMTTARNEKLKGISPEMSVLQSKKQKLQTAKQAFADSIGKKVVERNAEKKKLTAKIESLSAALEKSRIELNELQEGLDDARKEMAIYERGKQLGVASEVKFLEVQNYLHQREFSVDQQKLQIEEMERQLKAAKLELDSSNFAYNAAQADLGASLMQSNVQISSVPLSENQTVRSLENKQADFEIASYHASSHFSKERTEISTLQRKIDECKDSIEVLQAILAEKFIKAPVDGTVSDPFYLLPGEVVTRGQTLLTLVPSDNNLILRATVNNIDVGFLQPGQTATLSIDAYPCAEFGVIKGKVLRVGDYPEEVIEGQKKISAYKVTIRPDQPFIKYNHKQIELKPGLQVQAAIVLRKRSMLGLLFEPLMKVFEDKSIQRVSNKNANQLVKCTNSSITS